MVRAFKPRRIVEIGSGFSTRVTAAAIRANRHEAGAYECDLTCIEPFPSPIIKSSIPEITKLLDLPVQTIPEKEFSNLGENDILFIDSSHVVAPGSDVCTEILDIIPKLAAGVIVHVHDILLPQVYSPAWNTMKVFWNEQYLLQAFLAFNDSFEVMWAANYMHLHHPNLLAQVFPSYAFFKAHEVPEKRLLGHKSFWFRRLR